MNLGMFVVKEIDRGNWFGIVRLFEFFLFLFRIRRSGIWFWVGVVSVSFEKEERRDVGGI